jgi:SOS-response transcriptional repressor LexA
MDERQRSNDQQIAEAIGGLLASDPEGPLWRDDRFIDWLTTEARAHDRRLRRRTDAELAVQGRDMVARLRARRFGVRRAETSPTLRSPSVIGSPGHVLAAASREHTAPVVELSVAAGIGRELWDEPVEHWLELPADLETNQYLALKITGESMAPLMHTGDTVLVRLGADVERDTVVVARRPDDGYVCKRVGRLRDDTIELLSLGPDRPPIMIPRDPRLILGTVLMVWCTHGTA